MNKTALQVMAVVTVPVTQEAKVGGSLRISAFEVRLDNNSGSWLIEE